MASPYDAYILEEVGRITEQILTEYIGMHLNYAPHVSRASTASEAMKMLEEKSYDLIITMLRIADMDPITFGKQVKKDRPDLPVILLVFDATELQRMKELLKGDAIDKVFVWSGNANVLPVIIKYVEDRKNVESDMEMGDIRVIMVVEDSPRFYSIILPRIYREVMHHTTSLIDESLNDTHKLLRLRARPKILLASNYEEAIELIDLCGDNLLGVISDVRFPKNGKSDISAGFKLARWIRNRETAMPIRFPPPLSPAITICPLSIFKSSEFSCTHLIPDTQSLSPAGNGATSGAEEAHMQFLKSTMATATPFLAIHLPQAP